MSPEGFSQQAEALSLPFNEFVFKVAIGCNMQPEHELDRDPLALITPGCDHCYMYTHSTAWQQEPAYMEPHILEQAIERIAEHVEAHKLSDVRIIGHGGEPLLVLSKYPTYYTDFADLVQQRIGPTGTKTHLYLQTNGLPLNGRQGPRVADQLNKAGFTVGLSIDGPQSANDLHRRDKAGRSTHSRAERAARVLGESGANWGVLGVIDPRTDPDEVLEYLASLGPKSINLFPMHANHSNPPLHHPGAISLGEWQKRIFDRYNNWSFYHPDAVEPPFTLPIYDNYLRIAFGARSINDTSGERPTQELFITSGGKYERLDTLKSADDGVVKTWRNIYEHSIDDMRKDPGIIARRVGFAALASECQDCEVLKLCFGNHYPNRYREPEKQLSQHSSVADFTEAFRNPSAHCEDHKVFLGHIDELVKQVPRPVVAELQIPDDARELVEQKTPSWFYESLAGDDYERQVMAHRLPNSQNLFRRCLSFQSFPASPDADTSYELAPEDIEATFKAVQSQQLVGRHALMAAGMIATAMHPGPVAYYGDNENRLPGSNEAVLLSEDYNDAIVNSLIMTNQPYLRDLDVWAREKSNGYWFITRAMADSIFANKEAVQGYVVPAQLPNGDNRVSFIGPESGVDYMADIFYRSITSPVPINARDLPGDILIVDNLPGKQGNVAGLLHEAAASLPHYANPEIMAKTFESAGRGTITPLWGIWPSKVYGPDWQSRPFVPMANQRVSVAADVARILNSQLQDSVQPLFDPGRPLYSNVLAMAGMAF
jgi:uncharacterized protein